jgi:hypothetical protein
VAKSRSDLRGLLGMTDPTARACMQGRATSSSSSASRAGGPAGTPARAGAGELSMLADFQCRASGVPVALAIEIDSE